MFKEAGPPEPARKTRLSDKDQWVGMHAAAGEAAGYPDEAGRCGTFEIARVCRSFLPATKGLRMLEMGCGGSKWLPWFAKEMGYQVEGIDYTENGCAAARRNLEAAGVAGTIHCLDFDTLDSSFDGAYDVVTSFGVVEHFVNPVEEMGRFARCLRPGGYVVTFVPNMSSLAGSLIKRIDRKLFDSHKLFTLQEFSGYHSGAGLVPVFARYTEWLDFQFVPLDELGRATGLVAKNVVHVVNKAKIRLYKSFDIYSPQSHRLCSAMIAVAQKPASQA